MVIYSTKIHLKVTNEIQPKRMSLLLNKKIAFSHVGPSFVNPVNSVLGERLQADRDLRKSFGKVETCLLQF